MADCPTCGVNEAACRCVPRDQYDAALKENGELREALEEFLRLEADNPDDVLGGISGREITQFKRQVRALLYRASPR